MMKTFRSICMMCFAIVLSSAYADSIVTNVTARQIQPWGLVEIRYELTKDVVPPEGMVLVTSLVCEDRQHETNCIAQTLVNHSTLKRGEYAFSWDASSKGAGFFSSNAIFRVSVAACRYCVIDVSGGPLTTNYPVSLLNDVPPGGWTDEYKTTKIVLRYIVPGTFKMNGCYDEINGIYDEMNGPYDVNLTKTYCMGVFEVTQKQYELVTGLKPSCFVGDTRPVEQVSWNAIKETFISKLQDKTGLLFDLPTEAQWEYACRAGTTTEYNYGDIANGSFMWYGDNSEWQTHVVGTRQPNSWGLYDMHGNVCEWCLDWYGRLCSGTDPKGAESGLKKVLRGGDWLSAAFSCVSSHRYSGNPSKEDYLYGFRISRPLHNDVGINVSPNEALGFSVSTGVKLDLRTQAVAEGASLEIALANGEENIRVLTNGVVMADEREKGTNTVVFGSSGVWQLVRQVLTNDAVASEFAAYCAVTNCGAVVVQGSMNQLPTDLFRNCDWLKAVTIEHGVIKIGSNAFWGCSNLMRTSLPKGLGIVDGNAYCSCENLSNVDIPSLADWLAIRFGNAEANPLHTGAALFVDGKETSDLVIPETETEIGAYAFVGGQFASLRLPRGIVSVGAKAFAGCEKIKRVDVATINDWLAIRFEDADANPLRYGADLYVGGEKVTRLNIPAGVTEIGEHAFVNCGFTAVSIPPSVTRIATTAFSGCTNIVSIAAPMGLNVSDLFSESVTKISSVTIVGEGREMPPRAFLNCSALETVFIPDTVTSIGEDAFAGCENLNRVEVKTLKGWPSIRFANVEANPLSCGAMLYVNGAIVTELDIPDSVLEISDYAFIGLPFTLVSIPGSITRISPTAFAGCANIISVCVRSDVAPLSVIFPDSYKSISDVSIVASTQIMNDFANGCEELESLSVESKIVSIGDRAFLRCGKLSAFPFSDKLNALGSFSFARSGIREFDFAPSLETLGPGAFCEASQLVSVTISTNIQNWGHAAFLRCFDVTQIDLRGLPKSISGTPILADGWEWNGREYYSSQYAAALYCYFDYVITNSMSFTWWTTGGATCGVYKPMYRYSSFYDPMRYYSGTGQQTLQLADTKDLDCLLWTLEREEEGHGASVRFESSWLNAISLEMKCYTIQELFPNAYGSISSIVLPKKLDAIPERFFAKCRKLTNVELPTNLKKIGDGAFDSCSSLSNITIPDGIESLGEDVFVGCNSLTDVHVTSIGVNISSNVFRNCSSIRSVVFDCNVWPEVLSVEDAGWTLSTEGVYSCSEGNNSLCVTFDAGKGTEIRYKTRVISRGYNQYSVSAKFYLDGEYRRGITRASCSDWVEYSYSVGPGVHCVEWQHIAYEEPVEVLFGTTGEIVQGAGFKSLFPSSYRFITNVVFGADVPRVPSRFFSDCIGLTHCDITEGIQSVGEYAFCGCKALQVAKLPDSVSYLGREAYSDCENLQSVELSRSLTNISYGVFNGCANIKSVYLGAIPGRWYDIVSVNSSGWEEQETYDDGRVSYATDQFIPFRIDVNGDGGGSMDYDGYSRAEYNSIQSWTEFNRLDMYVDKQLAASKISGNRSCVLPRGNRRLSWEHVQGYMVYNQSATLTLNPLLGRHYNDTRLFRLFPDSYAGISHVEIGSGAQSIPDDYFRGLSSLCSVSIASSVKDFGDNDLRHLATSLTSEGLAIIDNWVIGFVGQMPSTLHIPDGVVGIAAYALNGQPDLEHVILPFSLRYIGVSAFGNCTGLDDVDFPDGVSHVDDGAFENCTWIGSLKLPPSVQVVGHSSFANCTMLFTAEAESGLTEIGDNAFSNCWRMMSVNLPASVDMIGNGAFARCKNIRGVSVPTHVLPMRDLFPSAFSNLTTMVVASNENVLVSSAFAGCEKTTAIDLPDSVVNIPDSAFDGCCCLVDIDIGESVTNIGSRAFRGVPRYQDMEELIIPSSVRTIGSEAFAGCCALKQVSVPGRCESLQTVFPDSYLAITSVSVTVGSTIVGPSFARNCTSLKNVNLCGAITNISCQAFKNCISLEHIVLPYQVLSIGQESFAGCGLIADITLPKSLISIESGAFVGCAMPTIVIPENLNELGDGVFSGCNSLSEVKFTGNAPVDVGDVYSGASSTLVTYVVKGSRGWDGISTSKSLPEIWPQINGREITFWTPNRLDVRFVAESALPAEQIVEQITGTTYSFPTTVPQKIGCLFNGWWTEPGLSGTRLEAATRVDMEKEHLFYAHWNAKYTDPIPELGSGATSDEVLEALIGSVDVKIAENIVNAAEYNAYRNWATMVLNPGGTSAAGQQAVKESPNAWLSYALNSDQLIETAPVQGDLKIDDFKHSATDGGFDMIVSLDGVNVGSEASKENLKKVFGIEGSTSLFGDSFSSASVDLEFGTPEKGKVKCTAVPKDKAATSFFIKMKLK